MDILPAAGLAAAAGYLCGSVPFAYLAVRLRTGKDLRREGSGNVGATNASRLLGRGWFFLIFGLDFAKGALPVLLAAILFRDSTGEIPHEAFKSASLWVRCAAGAGALLGHLHPVWLGFRGGKAVATGAGVLALLVPDVCGVGLLVGVTVLLLSRYVSVASIAGAVAATAWLFWSRRAYPGDQMLPVGLLVGSFAAVVVVRHIPNMARIAAGTEPRLFAKAEPPRDA